jgi:hypothetical protein
MNGGNLRGTSHVLAFVAAATLLQSCATTPIAWMKPDADQKASLGEFYDCRKLALDEMWRMSWERMWPPAFYNPMFMPPMYAAAQPFWLGGSGRDLEQNLIDFCMYSKGYRHSGVPPKASGVPPKD